jgi:hypothetical protein
MQFIDVLTAMQAHYFDGPTAATTNFTIGIEYSFESLGLGHRDAPFSG